MWTNEYHKPPSCLFCHITMGSASRSLTSTVLRLATTSGWGVVKLHPTWAKKKPLLTSWGSASVSLYLWCTLWSSAQVYTSFCTRKIFLKKSLICFLINETHINVIFNMNYTKYEFCVIAMQSRYYHNSNRELLYKDYYCYVMVYTPVLLSWRGRLKVDAETILLCTPCVTIICERQP